MNHLEHQIEMYKKANFPVTVYQAVQEHGQIWTRDQVTFKHTKQFSTPKECFANAMGLSLQSDMVYCEGYVVSDYVPMLIHHAWVVDSSGQVVETTLKNNKRDGLHYYGIQIPDAYGWIEDYYGVFDATDYIESLGYDSVRWLGRTA